MRVVELNIGMLEDHPDNPRRELGNLDELAASIREGGVKQNLTVVPAENGKYRVIIGHRRYHAAKLAGLETVPCTIDNMTEAEQLATMMAENMQRCDLTLSDQVYGTQCMMNLGLTTYGISEKTGISEGTVKKRAKIARMGYVNVVKCEQSGASIMDMLKIAELETEEERERAVNSIKKGNLQQTLSQIKTEKENAAEIARIVPMFEKFAEKCEKDYGELRNDFVYIRYISSDVLKNKFDGTLESLELAKEDNPKGRKLLYVLNTSSYSGVTVNLYRTKTEADKKGENAYAELEEKKRAFRDKVKSANEKYAKKREAWLKGFDGGKDDGESALEFAEAMSEFNDRVMVLKDLKALYGKPSKPNLKKWIIAEAYARAMNAMNMTTAWDCTVYKGRAIPAIATFFEKWGYPMDDEEYAFYEGKGEEWTWKARN